MPESTALQPVTAKAASQPPPKDDACWPRRVLHLLFALSLVLALATHSGHWRVGPFTWLPLLRLPALTSSSTPQTTGQDAMRIGLLALAPALLVLWWPALRLLELRRPARRRWHWGWLHTTGPLLGLTLLSGASLLFSRGFWPELAGAASSAEPWVRNAAFQVLSLGLVWFVYLFVVNERPVLTWPLAAVVAIQGALGVAQFVLQRDVGLAALGELRLDPEVRGISVLIAQDGQRWLRAYGLTGHPNLLAALLAILLLMLLRDLPRQQGWRRALLSAAVGLGVLGLLATVSRAAWLAFGIGLALWAVGISRRARDRMSSRDNRARLSHAAWVFLPVLAGVAFVVLYGGQLATRFFDLNSATEARSLFERTRDARIALALIGNYPWTGAGVGNYLLSARAIDPSARTVHNVPLLVTAELGVWGGLLWLWLAMAPFAVALLDWLHGRRALVFRLPPWLALVTVGLFHGLPWINTGWRAALLLALLLGDWTQAVQASRMLPPNEKPASQRRP